MGDPKRIRRKYEGPRHPWIASRIENEKALKKKYGTKSKKEIWKMQTILKRFKDQAKSLVSRTDEQAAVENEQMISRLVRLGLAKPGASLDDILSISINDIMNRRLQTIIFKKLLARTPKQARQLITHGHIMVNGKVVTSPSYLVLVEEEGTVAFKHNSPFANDSHPERFSEAELKAKEEKRKAKEAKQKVKEEEAPPTFSEEEIEDIEGVTKKKAKVSEEAAVQESSTETGVGAGNNNDSKTKKESDAVVKESGENKTDKKPSDDLDDSIKKEEE